MKSAELNVQPRGISSKSENRRLRRTGFVPANVYGPGVKNSYCTFDERDLQKLFRGQSSSSLILTLKSSDKELEGRRVILKAMEKDPVSWRTVHADLYQLDMTKALTISVSLEYKGTPVGVKTGGGILQVVRRSVQIKALPDRLPESIEVDISALEIGDSLHVSDLKVPEGVEIMDSDEYTLALIAEPQKEEEVVPVAVEGDAAAAAAPADGSAAPAAPEKKDEAK